MNGQALVDQKTPEMTLRDYLKVIFRQKAVIIAVILTTAVGAAVGLKLKTPVFESQVKMIISAEKQVDSPYYKDVIGSRNLETVLTQSEIVKSNPVIERAMSALKLYERPLNYEKSFASPLKQRLIDWQIRRLNMNQYTKEQQQALTYRLIQDDLKSNIKVEPIRDTNLFTIRVSDYNPVGAAILANVVSRSYVIFDLEQQLVELQAKYTEKNPLVTQLKENIANMEKGLSGKPLPNIEAIGPASVKVIEQASVPLKPVGINKRMLFLMAMGASVFLGLALAFAFDYLDQSFRSKDDVEHFLKIPVLACINRKKRLFERDFIRDVPKTKRFSPRAQSYNILADQLHFLSRNRNLRSVLITSVALPRGTGVLISNLAIFLSKKLGHEVLLIDADMRHPSLFKLFKVPKGPGLCEMIEGKATAEEVIHPVRPKLDVISPGESTLDPGIILDAAVIEGIIKSAQKKYSLILVNGPDLRMYKDSVVIASAVDGVVLAISQSNVRRQVVRNTLFSFEEKRNKLIGIVMTNRDYPIPKVLYDKV